MVQKYKDAAQFFLIYIKEAHPSDDWAKPVGEDERYYEDPKSLSERSALAETCVTDLGLSIPALIDDMDNSTARAYKAWPDRLYVVGKDGRIAFQGAPGPGGFDVGAAETALQAELRLAATS